MIRQFDVIAPPSGIGGSVAYLLVLQSDLLELADSVAVAPLIIPGQSRPIRRLNPVFIVEERQVYLNPTMLGSLPRRSLGIPIANLEAHRTEIIAAIDVLLSGV